MMVKVMNPVCRMEIEDKWAACKSKYKNKT